MLTPGQTAKPTGLIPSFRQFLELPISVASQIDGYREVTEALDALTQTGDYMQASLLADAAMVDDRIQAVIKTRTNAIFGLPMVFKWQGQDDPQLEDKYNKRLTDFKKFVTDQVETQWEAIFPSAVLREIVRWGLLMNLGVGELVWRWDHDLYLPTLKTWNPQFCYWRWDTRSNWINHTGGTAELKPGNGRWVTFAPEGHNHGQLYGLIRPLSYLFLDRKFLLQNRARGTEKYSLGVTKAFMPANADPTDKDRFEQAVRNMPHEATITLPVMAAMDGKEATKFDIQMMETDDSTHADMYHVTLQDINTEIAIVVLGQNLSTEISGSTGSRAAAKVHNDIREDILKADVENLSSMIKSQVLAPFVKYNYADLALEYGINWEDLVPNVTWNVEPPEDKVQSADATSKVFTAIAALVTAMAPKPGADGQPATKSAINVPVDFQALLEKLEIPILENKKAPYRPPPAFVSERPRAPANIPRGLPSPDFRDIEDADKPNRDLMIPSHSEDLDSQNPIPDSEDSMYPELW